MSNSDYPMYVQYAAQIANALNELFNSDSEFAMDQSTLDQDDNLTHFIHALASVVPNSVYNSLTGQDKNHIEFNHLANLLCIQFATREDDETAKELAKHEIENLKTALQGLVSASPNIQTVEDKEMVDALWNAKEVLSNYE